MCSATTMIADIMVVGMTVIIAVLTLCLSGVSVDVVHVQLLISVCVGSGGCDVPGDVSV